MCLGSTPKAPKVGPVITKRDGSSTSNRFTKRTASASGPFGNIFTSALGDMGFNLNTSKAVLFGQPKG